MQILILNHNAEGHGTFVRCFFLAKHLVKKGHTVTLTCVNSENGIMSANTKDIEGVNVVLLPSLAKNSVSDFPRHILRAMINIIYGIRNDFDVIHSFNIASPTTGLPTIFFKLMSVLRIKRNKIIVDWDDWWGRGGLTRLSGQGKYIEYIATYLEESIPKIADSVTVVSDPIMERAMGVGIELEKIFKIGNGSNKDVIKTLNKFETRKKLDLPLKKNILCFVGSVLTSIEFLLAVMIIIVKKHPDILLVLISPLKKSQLEMIQKCKLSSNIFVAGTQSYENMIQYLGASDILLLPRMNNICDYSTFPARMMDYLCTERPIVATGFGAAEKIISESNGGLLAKIDDADDFANKVLTLMGDPALCKELGINGRKAAESKYSWEMIADEFENVYKIT